MKLHILSDLHLSQGALAPPPTEADVVILAGDIARPQEAIAWASQFARPVLYVPGNHEFYGSSIGATRDALQRWSAGTCVQVLDDGEALLGGVRFLGTTLWTDFLFAGTGDARAAAMREARLYIRDFSRISDDEDAGAFFTPEASAERFAKHADWLESRLAAPHAGPTVVITHHAPSPRSVHPRFAGSALNACFVSDLERLVRGDRVRLWIHGHTHDSFDYLLNGTRVVCNPRGYAKHGVNENARFDPALVIAIDCQ